MDNVLYSNNKIVAIIENPNNGIDTIPINITGMSCKLKKLGWESRYLINDILNEIINS